MEKKIRKIVGFDSWVGGSRHYQRLLPALAERSIELTLVHISSWGNDPDCPHEASINGLLARDVAFYGDDSFERILDIERPDAVIFLSTTTFAHRAFIRYCHQRCIPTLNLYHGLVNVQVTGDKTALPTVAPIAHLKYVLSRTGKLLRHTFPCYIQSLLKTGATYTDWRRFIFDIVSMAMGLGAGSNLRASNDAKTTKCAVYAQADLEHAVRTYGFNESDVFVVGNPDFLVFGLKQEMVGSWVPPFEEADKFIMYIECGFASIGQFFSGAQDFADHLISSSRSLAAQGFKMRLKLKPNQAHNDKLMERVLKEPGIELVSNRDFLSRLMECSACIVETTTLAMIPALVGMPLLLGKYGKLKPLSFGSVLASYPRAYLLHDISDVSDILLKDKQISNSEKLNSWIGYNVGPLPPEKMPNRVVDIIDQMIELKR